MKTDNGIIAEFMGMTCHHNDNSVMIHMTSQGNERYDVDILQYGTRIVERTKTDSIDIVNNIADISFDSKIDHTYDAVVKFINHINKEKL